MGGLCGCNSCNDFNNDTAISIDEISDEETQHKNTSFRRFRDTWGRTFFVNFREHVLYFLLFPFLSAEGKNN